ncbi:pentatricopeptide repeat-containing protein At5g46580, chloroplastic [Selaginella moellendorffii]|nr:pentatricopeptide repeat-containing protein At5g46580, chloroplastic [Selaginella moellendorffii]|eukprot:XP_002975174.2 pentatricopeptide repeat-containing protein At5g46580, chloroplastic [Selaginella moellendorffii]
MAWVLYTPIAAAAAFSPIASKSPRILASSSQGSVDEGGSSSSSNAAPVVEGENFPKKSEAPSAKTWYHQQSRSSDFRGDTRKNPGSTKWTPDIGRADAVLQAIRNGISRGKDLATALESWSGGHLPSRTVVAVLGGMRDWKEALDFFRWARSRRDVCEITVFAYNMMLKLLRDGEQWSLSEELLKEMLEERIMPDNYTFSIFVSCSKRCDQAEDAIAWFHRLRETGVSFDGVTYSAMIDLYGKAGRTAEAMDLYQTMRKNNWKPDLVSFGVIANVYSRVGDYQAILRLFRDMEQAEIKPNVVLFNTLIGTLGRAGKVTLAKGMFDEMASYGLEPSEITLSILIDMYTKVGALDKALDVYDTIKQKKWKLDVLVYNTLLKSCVESGNIQRAESLIAEMEREKQWPDHMTYGILMNVYATKGMVAEVRAMFDKLKNLAVFPKAAFYTMLIKASKQAGDFDRIPGIFDEMIANGCSVNERMSGMLVSCASSSQISDETRLGVLECVKKIKPRLHELLSRLLVLAKEDDDFDDIASETTEFLLREITAPSRRPMCNAVIDFCCVLGSRNAARAILSSGVSAGLYHGLHTTLPSLWQLNLRTLSFAAAECALEAWIESLATAAENGDEFPEDLMVETGTGRAKEATNSVSLSEFVGGVLKGMDSPFEENRRPGGYFIASGEAAKAWLQSRKPELKN